MNVDRERARRGRPGTEGKPKPLVILHITPFVIYLATIFQPNDSHTRWLSAAGSLPLSLGFPWPGSARGCLRPRWDRRTGGDGGGGASITLANARLDDGVFVFASCRVRAGEPVAFRGKSTPLVGLGGGWAKSRLGRVGGGGQGRRRTQPGVERNREGWKTRGR